MRSAVFFHRLEYITLPSYFKECVFMHFDGVRKMVSEYVLSALSQSLLYNLYLLQLTVCFHALLS